MSKTGILAYDQAIIKSIPCYFCGRALNSQGHVNVNSKEEVFYIDKCDEYELMREQTRTLKGIFNLLAGAK